MIVDLATIAHLWPETVLVILAVWMLVGGAFQPSRWWWSSFSLAGYGVVAFVLCRNEWDFLVHLERQEEWIASGPIVIDYLGFALRLLAVVVGALLTLIAARTVRESLASEIVGSLMLVIVGVMLVTRANDLVFLFVGLELVSLSTYVLLYLGRRDRITSEATAKYFFLSIFSSALLLYGLSFLYGLAGTTTMMAAPGVRSVGEALTVATAANGSVIAPFALVFIIAGLGFKIAAVPFHFYAPDVYQGVTNGNAALLAAAPKIAGLAALVRVLVVAMPSPSPLAWQLLLVISIASMTLGNVCALWQNDLRRLMAYSSIAHAGYFLIGVIVAIGAGSMGGGNGVGAATLYVIVYALASTGVFAALAYLGGVENEVDGVEDLAGLGKTQPLTAVVLAICLISLAGIPPLAGFWGKLSLFFSAIEAAGHSESGTWFVALAIAGAVNAAIAAAYYLRVISVMYFSVPRREFGCEGGWSARVAMLASAILVVVCGVYPAGITRASRDADRSVQRYLVGRPASAIAGVPATIPTNLSQNLPSLESSH